MIEDVQPDQTDQEVLMFYSRHFRPSRTVRRCSIFYLKQDLRRRNASDRADADPRSERRTARHCRSELTSLAVQASAAGRRMTREPQLPQPTAWAIYYAAAKARWLGEVEAPDEVAAIGKAAEQFNVPAAKLIAVQRR